MRLTITIKPCPKCILAVWFYHYWTWRDVSWVLVDVVAFTQGLSHHFDVPKAGCDPVPVGLAGGASCPLAPTLPTHWIPRLSEAYVLMWVGFDTDNRQAPGRHKGFGQNNCRLKTFSRGSCEVPSLAHAACLTFEHCKFLLNLPRQPSKCILGNNE